MAIGNLQQIIPAFFTGPNGQPLTPEQIAQRQEVAKSLLQQAYDTSPNAGGWASVLAKGLQGGIAGYQQGRADDAASLNAKTDQANIEAGLGSIFGGGGQTPAGGIGGAFPSAVAQGSSPTSGVATGTIPSNFNIGDNQDVIRQGIIETAEAIGADPVDLATAISYETAGTFNPTKAGPTTQWGQHRGLIQFGEPQAKQHGVDWNDPIGSQLGANGAIANYFRSSGFKPGMSGLDLYSTINAGAPGRYSASDANNGGAPGSVSDKWNNQMRDHRAKALALLGVGSKDVTGDMLSGQQAIQAIAPIEQAANPYPEAGQIAPHDFTDNQTLSAGAGLPMQGMTPEQFDLRFNGQAGAMPSSSAPTTPGSMGEIRVGADGNRYQYVETTGMLGDNGGAGWIRTSLSPSQSPQQQQIDPRLASLNDQMLGGALSEAGRSEVAQALTGYFPDAPSANSAPITAQNNAMPQSPMQQPTGGVNPQVIASLLGPNSSPQARQVGALLLSQHQQQQDPMRKLQMQKMQAEVDQMRLGVPSANSAFGNLDAQARAAGLQQGTPEYQQFMLNGGGAPATFRALDMQAQAAGFQPGTQPYNDFMATRGAGLSAGAAQEAKNQADISSGGTAAGAIDLGKATIKAGVDAWSDYGKLQSSIGNIEESIRALDSGAKSGAVYKMLPNVTDASASLKNAMDRMGLDVIGSVTFGALSEGEMNLAMQTAVPRDLAPKELRAWLSRKLEAQKKASAMLASAAQYLTVPGNTINGWIERNIAEKSQRESQQPSQSSGGWSDAGNGVRIRPKGAN